MRNLLVLCVVCFSLLCTIAATAEIETRDAKIKTANVTLSPIESWSKPKLIVQSDNDELSLWEFKATNNENIIVRTELRAMRPGTYSAEYEIMEKYPLPMKVLAQITLEKEPSIKNTPTGMIEVSWAKHYIKWQPSLYSTNECIEPIAPPIEITDWEYNRLPSQITIFYLYSE